MGYTVISPSNPRKSPKWRCSWEYHHLNMVFNLTIWPDEMTLIGLRPLVYESSNARPSAADFWHSWRQISQHKASRMVQDGTRWYQPKMLNRNWNQRLQWMLVGDHFIITGCGFPNGVHCIAPSFPGLILCDHNDVTTRGWNGFALESLYFLYVCMSMCILYIYIYIIKRYIIFYVHPFSIESWATTKTVRVAWRNLKKQSTITSWHLSFPFSIGFWVCVRVEN